MGALTRLTGMAHVTIGNIPCAAAARSLGIQGGQSAVDIPPEP